MELKIKVICEGLPDKALVDSSMEPANVQPGIYLGIQQGEDIIEAVPANKGRVVFEPSFRVMPLPQDKTNFLGPFAKGTQTERFFYLSWAVEGEGKRLTRIGRAKIYLSHLRWSEVEESIHNGRPLCVKLSLTDKKGRPRCGSIRDARWQT
jgi:Family of unknown function (DUF5990)